MRTLALLFILLFGSLGNAMNVSIHTATFYSGNQPYIDIGFRILAGSISFEEGSNKTFQAAVDVSMTVLDSTGTYVVGWEKYKLMAADLKAPKDLIDQRRFALAPGKYVLKLSIEEEGGVANSFGMEKRLTIKALARPDFSDLNLITSMEKREEGPFVYNGIYMEPFAFDVVNETQQVLHFYSEYYPNPDLLKDTNATALFRYAVHTGFEPSDSSQQMMVVYKKSKLNEVVPLTGLFDLNKLISGNYHLEIAHITKQKEVISHTFSPFINRNFPADIAGFRNYNTEVSNSFVAGLDSITLRTSLQCLAPQLPTEEASSLSYALSGDASTDVKKYYLFKYWKDRYPTQPEAAYEAYMKVVKAVDNQFYSAFGKGHQTDRGYVFLKYGKPNKVVSIDDEANTPPYEIWYYDFMQKTGQPNVRFIFYSPMLANEYELLHSTCRGERSNKQWEIQLYKNSKNEAVNPGIDATTMNSNWNRKARKLFEEQ